jgi:tetratricopeptide (TPR) repeat protein
MTRKKGRPVRPFFFAIQRNTRVSFILLQRHSLYLYLAALTLLLFTIWLAYAPGLRGNFLFDDYANLPALGAMGPVHSWPSFWRYITSGNADPTGRPLALLSFLVDSQDWPASPYPFKRTNLILHLLNSVLLTYLLRKLGYSLAGYDSSKIRFNHDGAITSIAPIPNGTSIRIDMAAVLATAFWALHPFFVSTTLYIVQREAMLPATCALIGLLLWLSGREQMRRGQYLIGACGVMLGIGGFTVLGALSKANGALMPLYVLLIEYLILQPHLPMSTAIDKISPAKLYNNLLVVFAWLPALLVVGYLLYQGWTGLTRGIGAIRPWSLGDRLLTEPRVLFDYLHLLWMPKPFTSGLFNEQIKVSDSLWAPATTLPGLLGVITLIWLALSVRRKWPALSLAILFFFAGHLMESSTIALEIYYEHRNYVPALFMFWPLARWLCAPPLEPSENGHGKLQEESAQINKINKLSKRNKPALKAAMAITLLIGLTSMTHANAVLWGDTRNQAMMWATLNPWSPRAQANAAQEEMIHGQPLLAIARLTPLIQRDPNQLQIAINLLGAKCMLGGISNLDISAAETAMATTRDPGSLLVSWSDSAIDTALGGKCQGFNLAMLKHLFSRGMENPYFAAGRKQDLLHILGNIAVAQKDPAQALSYFDAALDAAPRIDTALGQAAQLGAAGYPEQGLSHLTYYDSKHDSEVVPPNGMPRVHAWVLRNQDYWNKEITHLRASLQSDAHQSQQEKLPSS